MAKILPNFPTKHLSPQCQVVMFRWRYDGEIEGLSNSDLSQSFPYDISNYIKEVTFGKQLSSPSGQFQIVLPNDRDWKEYISIGTWCLIYISNDNDLSIPDPNNAVTLASDTKVGGNILKGDSVDVGVLVDQVAKLRCIGYVDTVRAQGSVDDNGAFDVNYVVSGRDYGVVYEETELWHNRVQFDSLLLEAAKSQINSNSIKTVDRLLDTLHRLIYSPDDITTSNSNSGSLTSLAKQWLLPEQLIKSLGLDLQGKTSFYGNIPNLLKFDPSVCTYPIASPTDAMEGEAWGVLKNFSIQPFHELFTELDNNGLPNLRFRPIPWKISSGSLFPDIAPTIDKFHDPKDINNLILLDTIDILNFDLGRDNHTRYNLFYSMITPSHSGDTDTIAILGNVSPETGFPRVLQNSVRRYGLRKLYHELDALIVLGAAGPSEKANTDLLRQYNELGMEYWRNSHYMESGTIEIIGNSEVRLGKGLQLFDDAPYNASKVFYIEGYEETYFCGENGTNSWTQSIFVTRGLPFAKYDKLANIDKNTTSDLLLRDTPYDDKGDFTKN